MPASQPGGSRAESLAAIRQVADLSQGLALVLVAGPATHAHEGLTLIRDALDAERQVVWHRLDRQGADLAATLDTADIERHALLLVHGLERLLPKARRDIEVRLNLLRDSLAGRRALIVLWIPDDELRSFRQHCPDLFHWRSLLVTWSQEDIPLAAKVTLRRRYLLWILDITGRASLPQAAGLPLLEVYVEPEVRIDNTTQTVPFRRWAADVQYGLLRGEPGSGKTVALRAFVHTRAQEALEEPSIPLPLWAPVRCITEVPGDEEGFGVLIDSMLFQDAPARDPGPWDRWAEAGSLQLFLDGLDEVTPELRAFWHRWLDGLRRRAPRLRVIVAGRPGSALPEQHWEQATLLPWGPEQVATYLYKRLPTKEAAARISAMLKRRDHLWDGTPTPLMLELIVSLAAAQTVPTERTQVFDAYVDLVIGGWDQQRQITRLRSTASPRDLPRQLARVALRALERDAVTFAATELPAESLDYLEARSGLIREIAPGNYAFTHRTLFEYFAARGMAELGAPFAFELLRDHLDESAWREVILMAIARLVRLTGRDDWIWTHLWPRDDRQPAAQKLDRMALSLACALEAGVHENAAAHVELAKRALSEAAPGLDAVQRLRSVLARFGPAHRTQP